MSQEEPRGKWYWVEQGYRWRVITTSAFDDAKIVGDVPCKMPADIQAAFEGALQTSTPGESVYLVQWNERARFGSLEWERIAQWDGQRTKVHRIGKPDLDEDVDAALNAIDPGAVLG